MSSIDVSELDDECITFEGCIAKEGYGRKGRDGKVYNAHRLAWIEAHGPIPDGLVVDHVCRNRACVNLNHLRLLTRKKNLAIGIVHNRTKTHCPRGHEYDRTDSRGRRECSICRKAQALAYYYRSRDAQQH